MLYAFPLGVWTGVTDEKAERRDQRAESQRSMNTASLGIIRYLGTMPHTREHKEYIVHRSGVEEAQDLCV